MSYVKVTCAQCEKTFVLVQADYNSRIKRVKEGKMYCGQKCVAAMKRIKAKKVPVNTTEGE